MANVIPFLFLYLHKYCLYLKVLLLDNYDSFTYNLLHYLEGFDAEVTVVFNDQFDLNTLHHFDRIVLSPGPGLPFEAGKMMEVISRAHQTIPIFGVCLGFQAIVEFLDGSLYNQEIVKHGVAEFITIDPTSKLFKETPTRFKVGLYHSWAANYHDFPSSLKISAKSENDVIMAFEHEKLPLAGVQFHPESILSENGKKIVENFILNFH